MDFHEHDCVGHVHASIAESIARCSSRATIAPLDMSSVVGGDAVDSVDLALKDSLGVLASLHSKACASSLGKLQRGANQALQQSSALETRCAEQEGRSLVLISSTLETARCFAPK